MMDHPIRVRHNFLALSTRASIVPLLFFFLFLLCSSGVLLVRAQDGPSVPPAAPKPAFQVDLSTTGYRPPSRMERLSEDAANVSLNYLDGRHVLVTFNPKKMIQRRPECTPQHDDRLVHAVVLEIPSGRVVKQAEWYLHDRRRYLWSLGGGPLGAGKLLLRKLNSLYVVDCDLRETLLLNSHRDLLWVSVTPDGRQIIVETENDKVKEKNAASGNDSKAQPSKAAAKPAPKYAIEFLDAKTLAPQRVILSNDLLNLEASSTGYVDMVHQGALWLIRFGPTAAQRHNLARVRSQNVPSISYASNNSILIGRCPTVVCDYNASAFTVTGHHLWRQHWHQLRSFLTVVRSEDGHRFGASTLVVAPSHGPDLSDEDSEGAADRAAESDDLEQDIQIFETASGSPVLSLRARPAVMSGQNFSLSPDGLHVAVLRDSSLEVFDLPPVAEEEQTKFLALKADVPGLYTLAGMSDSDSPPDAENSADHASEKATQGEESAPSETGEGKINASASASDATDASLASNLPSNLASNPAAALPADGTSSDASGSISARPKADDRNELVTTIRVSTKAVLVDVVVTDSKGRPIRGLRQQDFQLTEDGKPQDVRSFKEFSSEDNAPTAPAAGAKLPPNVYSNDTAAPDPGPITLVLLDLLNTPAADQTFARQQLIKFLQTKPKDSQFALCTLGQGDSYLRMIQGFTQDENQLLGAMRGKKAATKAAHWQAGAVSTAITVQTVGDLAQGGPTSGFQNLFSTLQNMQAEQQGADTDERAGITIDSLMELARYLSGFPGRKNLVWLSGSFPISLMANPSPTSSFDSRSYIGKIKTATNLLAEAQIAVYPVDVRGLMGGGPGADTTSIIGPQSLELSNSSSTRKILAANGGVPQGLQAQAQEEAERDTLAQFAIGTGGKAFYNTNAIKEAIGTAYEQGSNYYTLSYSPENKLFNGKFRKIRVSLAEKGYSLHYRQGYFADDANTLAKEAELARRSRIVAMQHASPTSRQILFKARVVTNGAKKKVDRAALGEILMASARRPNLPSMIEVQHYSIDYVFDGSELRFLQQENTYRSTLTLMVSSFDSEGRILTGTAEVGNSNLESAVYKDVMAGEFRIHQEVDVPMEAVSLRLGIQDQMSNHLGTVEIPLPVPAVANARRRRKNSLPEIEPD